MRYFRFKTIKYQTNKETYKTFSLLHHLLKLIIPLANPDFEGKYNEVGYWYIEYDEIHDYPNREVGINDEGDVIVKSPYRNNIGFWIDTDLTLKDYEQWNIENISKDTFDNLWNRL